MQRYDILHSCFKRERSVSGKPEAIEVSAIAVSDCNMKQLILSRRPGETMTRREAVNGLPTFVPTRHDKAAGSPVRVPGMRGTAKRLPGLEGVVAVIDNTDIRRGRNFPENVQLMLVVFRMMITSDETNLNVLIIRTAVCSAGNTMVSRFAEEMHFAFLSTLVPLELLQLGGPSRITNMTSMKTLTLGAPTGEAWMRNMKFAAFKLGDVFTTINLSRLLEESNLARPSDALAIMNMERPQHSAQVARLHLAPQTRASVIARHHLAYMMRMFGRWPIPQHVERACGPPPPPPRQPLRRRRARRLRRRLYIGRA